jgi:hypothetical protein
MTVPELVTRLAERQLIKPSRRKDLATAVKYLSRAYQVPPEGLADLATIEATYRETLRAYLASLTPPKSPHVIRNAVDNIGHVFTQARAAGLLAATPPPPKTDGRHRGVHDALRRAQETSPYRAINPARLRRYFVPEAQWPAEIRERWQAYATSIRGRVRDTTLYTYERTFTQYLSYSLNPVDQTGQPLHADPPITRWDDLFDPARLQRFTAWHTARMEASSRTRTAWEAAKLITMIAKETNHPAYARLSAWMNATKARPAPMHNKRSRMHSFSTAELERVALAMLAESRQPFSKDYALYHKDRPRHRGMRRALLHQLSLILRLLWRTGLRQRNIREMRWDRNLYQDGTGEWRLRFVGKELKIAQRRGEVNIYDPPFPADLVDHLEEFRETFRPCLMNAATDPHVFLTFWGKPYTQRGLRLQLAAHVYLRTGKRFYPHLARSIWADEWMHQGGDPDTAAALLNDSLQTVLTYYRKLKTQDLFLRAQQYNAQVTERHTSSSHGHGSGYPGDTKPSSAVWPGKASGGSLRALP